MSNALTRQLPLVSVSTPTGGAAAGASNQTYTIGANEGGTLYLVNYLANPTNAQVQTFVLPAPSSNAGAVYEFLHASGGAKANITVVIQSTGANIIGSWSQVDGSQTPTAAGSTTLTFTATSINGDRARFVSTGSGYLCSAFTGVADGLVFA